MTGMFKVTIARPLADQTKAVCLIASSEDEALEIGESYARRLLPTGRPSLPGWLATDAELVGADALCNIFEIVEGNLAEVRR